MKIYLAAKDDYVKDNHPAWNTRFHFKRRKNKIQNEKKCIYYNGTIAQYHQCIL